MDLDCCASYRFPQPIEGPIMDFLVPFEPLNRILRSAKGQVALLLDKHTVIVRTFVGQSPIDQRLDTKPVDEWPTLPAISALPIPLTGDAIAAIREAMDFASEDSTRIVLNSVHLDVSNPEAHYVVGTNGRALFSANSFKFPLKESISIPTHKFWLWNGLPLQSSTLIVQPASKTEDVGWLKFQIGDWTFTTKQQVGTYPNWRQVVPNQFNLTLDFSEDAVTAVLLAVPNLPNSDEQNKPVTLRVTKKQVFLEAHPASIPVPGVSIDGNPVTIRFNREYLVQCLKIGLTTIELTDELSPLVFTKAGKRAVVMPLRNGEAHVTNAAADQAPEPTPQPQPANETPAPTPTKEETKPVSTTPATETNTTPESPLKDVLKNLDDLKENLRDILRDLQHAYNLVKQAEKEKKATDKEIESVRAKLREIQSVKI
jgi:DNA polymerase III sliding clamp (beta) subunit (PCNA family)